MIVQLGAFLCAAAVWALGYRHDRAGTQNDLKWVLFFWYTLTSWSQKRWVVKAWTFIFWSLHFSYAKHQRGKREQEAIELESRKLARESKHGLYRSKFDYNDAWSPMKPVMFPCRTSHTRLFPKKHSFSYSYLFVGIPVGWRGYVSTILSADLESLPWKNGAPRNGWFNVDSADYLARGKNPHGLQGKLDDYLETQVGVSRACLMKVLISLS